MPPAIDFMLFVRFFMASSADLLLLLAKDRCHRSQEVPVQLAVCVVGVVSQLCRVVALHCSFTVCALLTVPLVEITVLQ